MPYTRCSISQTKNKYIDLSCLFVTLSQEEMLLTIYNILLKKPRPRLYGIWHSMKPQFKLTIGYTKVAKKN